MANGFAPYLLLQIAAAFGGKIPARKITPPGYTQMLLGQGTPNVISASKSDASGHVRDVKYWYRKPGKKGASATTDNCNVDVRPSRFEGTIPSTLFRKRTFLFEDDVIAQYETEASKVVKPAINGTGKVMELNNFQGIFLEIYDTIIEECRGLMADINSDLLTQQVAAFGVNAVTGTNAVTSINFPMGPVNPLNQGMTKILGDARKNEFDITQASLVGSGMLDYYMIQHLTGAKGTDQSGINTNLLNIAKNYYYDPEAAAIWGDDQFGIFDMNAVQLLQVDRFVGMKAGERPGALFFNAPLPLVDSLGNVISMNFDWQIEYSSCPQTINIAGVPTAVGRGWIVTLSKSFSQVNLPNNLYQVGDVLAGNNGTLRYEASNNCVDCPDALGSGSGE